MELDIREADFESLYGKDVVNVEIRKKGKAVLGQDISDTTSEIRQKVLGMLPSILANKVEKMLPKDFEVREMQMTVTLSGNPFGIGVSGDVVVKFGPK